MYGPKLLTVPQGAPITQSTYHTMHLQQAALAASRTECTAPSPLVYCVVVSVWYFIPWYMYVQRLKSLISRAFFSRWNLFFSSVCREKRACSRAFPETVETRDKSRDEFHCMQMSLVMSMTFIFGDDWNDACKLNTFFFAVWQWRNFPQIAALDFRVSMHVY